MDSDSVKPHTKRLCGPRIHEVPLGPCSTYTPPSASWMTWLRLGTGGVVSTVNQWVIPRPTGRRTKNVDAHNRRRLWIHPGVASSSMYDGLLGLCVSAKDALSSPGIHTHWPVTFSLTHKQSSVLGGIHLYSDRFRWYKPSKHVLGLKQAPF